MLAPRNGDWMQTYTGRQFWPLDPHVDDIDIVDIAHALAQQCRYGGHSRRFYSIAEHSIIVSHFCTTLEAKRAALLHDASEAYLVDIPRPVKKYLSNYKELEAALCRAIAQKFDVVYPWPKEVTDIDERILLDERNQLMGGSPAPKGDGWPDHLEPLLVKIHLLDSRAAERAFMGTFNELFT